MARGGIYKSEVLTARNNLLAQGRYPSIDAIRNELGNTGSKTTIHRYLKEIEEEENGGSDGKDKKVAASEAILELSSRLAERLHQEADERISALTDKHKAEITELSSTIEALKNQVETLQGQCEQLETELAAEKSAHADTQSERQEIKLANAKLTQQIQGLEAQQSKAEEHRLSLEEKHQHARNALDHFRAAAKEQRERDARQFEQQLQFLQSELRAIKESLNIKQQELITSNENNARLSTELKHVRSASYDLDQEVRALRLSKEQLALAELKNKQLSSQLATIREREADLLAENKNFTAKLQQAIAASRQFEQESLIAKASLAANEQILQKLIPPQKIDDNPLSG